MHLVFIVASLDVLAYEPEVALDIGLLDFEPVHGPNSCIAPYDLVAFHSLAALGSDEGPCQVAEASAPDCLRGIQREARLPRVH